MHVSTSVICAYCDSRFLVTLKRFNESRKVGWRFYCSKECRKFRQMSGATLTCCNPTCNKSFYRSKCEVNPSGANYCSQSCATIVNNKLRKHYNLCLNPTCGKEISISNKYCSNKCQGDHLRIPLEENKRRVTAHIQDFVIKNARLPVKRELQSVYQLARKSFGTWNKAIKAAGFKPNPVMFAHKHWAQDGHLCDSFAEKIIDDWLFANGISHQINTPYPNQPKNSRMTADFVVGNIWIEFFGLAGEHKKYDALMQRKLALVRSLDLNFIALFPADLFPENRLLEKLDFLVQVPAKHATI